MQLAFNLKLLYMLLYNMYINLMTMYIYLYHVYIYLSYYRTGILMYSNIADANNVMLIASFQI